MSSPNLLSIKQALHQYCAQRIQEQVNTIASALASIEESRNNETKSSVGDKYETGRAMMQMEEEKYQRQLANTLLSKKILNSIDPQKQQEQVGRGSLVITDSGKYYFSVAMGKIKIEDELYYAVSTDSPIGQILLHKRVGEHVDFNGKRILILAVS